MRINEQIRIPQVRLFDDTTDEALGIVPIDQARQLAVERGLDLVEVAATAQPPVCRLMDYGRFKFEALKREKDSRRDHNVVQLKEQKLRPKISDNDFKTKLAKVKQFLGEGDKVKLTIMFRGREMVHQEYGRRLLDRMNAELRDLAIIERSPLVEGRNMIMILSPTAKKHPRAPTGHDERPRRPEGDDEPAAGPATTASPVGVAEAAAEATAETPAQSATATAGADGNGPGATATSTEGDSTASASASKPVVRSAAKAPAAAANAEASATGKAIAAPPAAAKSAAPARAASRVPASRSTKSPTTGTPAAETTKPATRKGAENAEDSHP